MYTLPYLETGSRQRLCINYPVSERRRTETEGNNLPDACVRPMIDDPAGPKRQSRLLLPLPSARWLTGWLAGALAVPALLPNRLQLATRGSECLRRQIRTLTNVY